MRFFIISLLVFLSCSYSYGQVVVVQFSNAGTWTWTCPPNVMNASVQCIGGGGAGGGAKGGVSDVAGGGGGGGANVIVDTVNVIPMTDYCVTVGAGGAASLNQGDGASGGASWFGSDTTILAVGGAGGSSGVDGNAGFGAGGYGGSAGSCIPSIDALSGMDGVSASNSSGSNSAGAGAPGVSGTTTFGGSGALAATGPQGANGNPGIPIGGGSGGLTGSVDTSAKGGNGAPGMVIIMYTAQDITSVVNINESTGFNATAFPNPTNGKTNVQFNSSIAAPYSLKLFDLVGAELLTTTGKSKPGLNTFDLDLACYAKGLYILHLQSDDKNTVIKLMVE